jgi:uncharacterized membrane protein YGL010W
MDMLTGYAAAHQNPFNIFVHMIGIPTIMFGILIPLTWLQFIGHAVEKSMPVLVKHPIQANLAAPFFTVVEMCKILGLRDDLFTEVQNQIAARRSQEHGAA